MFDKLLYFVDFTISVLKQSKKDFEILFISILITIIFYFVIRAFVFPKFIHYIKNLEKKYKILHNANHYGSYIVISIILTIISVILSFFYNVDYLFSLVGYFLFLTIIRFVSDLVGNRKIFNIGIVYGLIVLFQEVDIVTPIYREMLKIKLNIIFTSINFFEIIQAATFLLLLSNIRGVVEYLILYFFKSPNSNYHLILRRVVNYSFYIIVILKFVNIFGLKKENIAMFISALGIGFGFAMQKIVGSLFSGFMLLYEERIRTGDLVEIKGQDISGNIMSIGSRTTIVRNFKNEDVIVPNDVIVNSSVVNMDLNERKSRANVDFIVDQREDLKKIIQEALNVANENPLISKAVCLVEGVDINGFQVSLKVFTDDYNNPKKNIWALKSDIIVALHSKFKEYNIKFAYNKIERL